VLALVPFISINFMSHSIEININISSAKVLLMMSSYIVFEVDNILGLASSFSLFSELQTIPMF
jgi:hypothetical protein